MVDGLSNRIEQLLCAVNGDEDAFNRLAEAERLDVYLRRGRLYASAIGQSHTARLAGGLVFGQPIPGQPFEPKSRLSTGCILPVRVS
jgi:hypothetical protein